MISLTSKVIIFYKLISEIFFILVFCLIILIANNHPLFLVFILILVALINSYFILKIYLSYWVSVIIILGFVGGIIILFIFSTSLSPNEKFFFIEIRFWYLILLILFLKPFIIISNERVKIYNIKEIYSSQFFIIIFIIIIILLMLNYVIKIIFDPLISLKSFFYEKRIKIFSSIINRSK